MLTGAGKCRWNMIWDCGNTVHSRFPHLLSPVLSLDSLEQGTQPIRQPSIILCLGHFLFEIRTTACYAYHHCRAAELPRHPYHASETLPSLIGGACVLRNSESTAVLVWNKMHNIATGHTRRKSPASYTPILPHGAREGPSREAIGKRLTPQ